MKRAVLYRKASLPLPRLQKLNCFCVKWTKKVKLIIQWTLFIFEIINYFAWICKTLPKIIIPIPNNYKISLKVLIYSNAIVFLDFLSRLQLNKYIYIFFSINKTIFCQIIPHIDLQKTGVFYQIPNQKHNWRYKPLD